MPIYRGLTGDVHDVNLLDELLDELPPEAGSIYPALPVWIGRAADFAQGQTAQPFWPCPVLIANLKPRSLIRG